MNASNGHRYWWEQIVNCQSIYFMYPTLKPYYPIDRISTDLVNLKIMIKSECGYLFLQSLSLIDHFLLLISPLYFGHLPTGFPPLTVYALNKVMFLFKRFVISNKWCNDYRRLLNSDRYQWNDTNNQMPFQ